MRKGGLLRPTRFRSHPLPAGLEAALLDRLRSAHTEQPFTPLEPRRAARRVAEIVAEFDLDATLYRGGLDLRGVEVDHVWLAVNPSDVATSFVVDAAFPLFSPPFVAELRRFVCGDASREDLAVVAEDAPVDDRVLGVFPPPVHYLGAPVWSAR